MKGKQKPVRYGTGEEGILQCEDKLLQFPGRTGASERNCMEIVPSILDGAEKQSQLMQGWGWRLGALCNGHSSVRRQIYMEHKKVRVTSQDPITERKKIGVFFFSFP